MMSWQYKVYRFSLSQLMPGMIASLAALHGAAMSS
jgi:hypothetical protein